MIKCAQCGAETTLELEEIDADTMPLCLDCGFKKLAKTTNVEPDLLRGIFLHLSGDHDGATNAFVSYVHEKSAELAREAKEPPK